jgi:hypothetical protein
MSCRWFRRSWPCWSIAPDWRSWPSRVVNAPAAPATVTAEVLDPCVGAVVGVAVDVLGVEDAVGPRPVTGPLLGRAAPARRGWLPDDPSSAISAPAATSATTAASAIRFRWPNRPARVRGHVGSVGAPPPR